MLKYTLKKLLWSGKYYLSYIFVRINILTSWNYKNTWSKEIKKKAHKLEKILNFINVQAIDLVQQKSFKMPKKIIIDLNYYNIVFGNLLKTTHNWWIIIILKIVIMK